jgi:senataxin
VKQKQGESASDKQKHRTAGGDTDSIRAAILEESVIVCKSNCLESGI